MDDRDLKILLSIERLGTKNIEKISEDTQIPSSTIHYRLNRMEENGVINDDTFSVELDKLGLSITVITDVMADFSEGYQETIGEKLSNIEGVNQVYFIMGEIDFVVISHLPNRDSIEQLVNDFQDIEGINRTNSKFVVTRYKIGGNPVGDYTFNTLMEKGEFESNN
ncbi:Lrp/AsnC family transcriptional regulator [Halobellus limi]|uniref:DNA-binding transcriptional regulator, Lrp family n=1 Tax=Halobellus limi TaxID=699433 RepID=A0A1H6BPC8_9EURY|nr:Lrp/AsnC family transcriptional regulator [Halobellus limi]QCC49400.1 Lrp/AsnC family transcriptional regulator [Halobellus limi]SEG62551.1 DNA-binding transcriptional regulator, Lrp family [Halobellus limi]